MRAYDVYDYFTNEKKGEFLNVESSEGTKIWYLANDGLIRSVWPEEIYLKRVEVK